MISNCLQGLSFLVVLLALTVPALQTDWQGSGSMNTTVMTEIHTQINNNPITSSTSPADVDVIAQTISTRLNSLWDPAWNVMVSISPSSANTILYGYAFNNQWMWINGVSVPSTPRFCAYLIWKDCNCNQWKKMSEITSTTFTPFQNTKINAHVFSGVNTDVWTAAFNFVEYLNLQTDLRSGAYTVVLS